MAAAFNAAFEQCKREGRNPGRVGHRLLTNNAKGLGVIQVVHDRPSKKELRKKLVDGQMSVKAAVSAGVIKSL
jgi:hypothetical protein